MDGMGTDVGIHVAGHFFPWISCLPTLNCLEGFFSARATHYRERLQAKRWGNPVFGSIYIYIETYDFFFGVNMALHLLKCVRSESAGGAAYQAGSVSENNPPRENQQRFIGEKWWWSNLCHNVVSDGESWSYFFGSNLQTIEPLLVLHVVAVQKAFVAGVAGYGCKELWHVMGKDCEGLRR